MPTYRPVTNFAIKDDLPTEHPQKAITGVELQREFEAINAAVDSMMTGYDGPLTNFAAKDLLSTGSAAKVVDGAAIDAEFAAVAAALANATSWSYAQTTTFASETTIYGAKLQTEFDALAVAITTVWDAGVAAALLAGGDGISGPFWVNPMVASVVSVTAHDTDSITIGWTATTGGTLPLVSYKIYRAIGAGAFSLLTTVGPAVLTYQDTGLDPDTTYKYYVVATDSTTPTALTKTSNTVTQATDQIVGFGFTDGAVSPGSADGYASVDATGFGFYVYSGGTKTFDNVGVGYTVKMFALDEFIAIIIEGPSTPASNFFNGCIITDTAGPTATILPGDILDTTTSGNMRRWLTSSPNFGGGVYRFTVGHTYTVEFT